MNEKLDNTNGATGQDRASYSDTQDREHYTVSDDIEEEDEDEIPPRYVEKHQAARRHLLLPQAIEQQLPALGATDENPDATAMVKFFSPYTGWTWYAFEYDPKDQLFFGLVQGLEHEWGYFSLEELEATLLKGGVPAVERDCYITTLPTKRELSPGLFEERPGVSAPTLSGP